MTRNTTICSFGEIVWDVFSSGKVLGGAPLNFSYFCAHLGARSSIISAVGRDTLGEEALEIIKINKIDHSAVSEIPDVPTGRVDVTMGAEGKPFYDILSPSAWDFIQASDAAKEIASQCSAFSFGTLAQRGQISRTALKTLLNVLPKNCLKILDINLRQNFYDKEIIEDSIRSANILKINDEELQVLKPMFNISGESEIQAGNEILNRFGLKNILLTMGKNGYIVFSADESPAKGGGDKIEIVDTVGAGDSFTAAFVVETLRGKSHAAAAKVADELAMQVCARKGAFCF